MPEEYLELYEDIDDEDRQTYLAMVTHMDDGVKQVMDALKETGMVENTLVVFMSDVKLSYISIHNEHILVAITLEYV